jgi:hypothetical protein
MYRPFFEKLIGVGLLVSGLAMSTTGHASDSSPECVFLSFAQLENRRKADEFDHVQFEKAKATFVEALRSDQNAEKLLNTEKFPKTSEEFLAFLEASIESKLPNTVKASEAWGDQAVASNPRVIKARKALIATLRDKLPWALTEVTENGLQIGVEVPQQISFKSSLKLMREIYKLNAIVAAARRGDEGFLKNIFQVMTGQKPLGSAWKNLAERYSGKIDRIIEERIVNDVIERDVLTGLQKLGFVSEFGMGDRLKLLMERNPAIFSIAEQAAFQSVLYSTGVGLLPPLVPRTRIFDVNRLNSALRERMRKEGFSALAGEIRAQLGRSPHVEYIIAKARTAFAVTATVAMGGVVYNLLNSPEGERFWLVLRMLGVSKKDLEELESSKSDEEIIAERIKSDLEGYELMWGEIDENSRRIAEQINRETSRTNTPEKLLASKQSLIAQGNEAAIIYMVERHWYWTYFVEPKDRRYFSQNSPPNK